MIRFFKICFVWCAFLYLFNILNLITLTPKAWMYVAGAILQAVGLVIFKAALEKEGT